MLTDDSMKQSDPAFNHYHVVAVQDHGGSQEYWRAWGGSPGSPGNDGVLGETDARVLARNVAACDVVSTHFGGTEVFEAALENLGDRFFDLASSSVAPGWEQIWIVGCDHECRSDGLFDYASTQRAVWDADDVGTFNWNDDEDGEFHLTDF